MDTIAAFAMGQANRNNRSRVFDWDRAAHIMRESGAQTARAGLEGDWEWTGGDILRDGEPVPKDDTYTYLASTWATPQLEVDDGELVECWRYADETGWDAGTYWPDSAVAILKGTP